MKMKPVLKAVEEEIFPQDLKMWAKSAGRKFKQAYDRVITLEKNGIASNAYWDADNNIIVRTEDDTWSVNEKFKDE